MTAAHSSLTSRASSTPTMADQLTDAEFIRLRDYFYRRTGIQFPDNKRYFVDKRVIGRIRAFGPRAGFDEWFSAVRHGTDSGLVQELINELTVNETYFLREDYQFDSLVGSVLPAVMAQRKAERITGPVRIMSLPTSTGEEPYSIAIRLMDDWPDIETVDVEIAGGDIDTRALERARQGVYGARSLQRVSRKQLSAYFRPAGEDRYQVIDDLREAISFDVINVTDPEVMRRFRSFDVIFCRNLLIYFDELSMRQAAENIFGALRPGGFLFLGHSESMSRISPIFEPVRFPEGLVYQRPSLGARR
ncbi:chemotaxis protein methyltransferase [Kineosporia sp. NBRC 101677]|uniref:CheR family methyltransferase n=1 Tax=Kineosporia sp. NBRC 101677 TaxID=3032197 RepID=UPI0024A02D57|nr:protein-glutamate O-methyltransferase CheR [Kineosporia sp. NBRC 101677]GLY17147.1 chemotaxis protein methyltransferase [Kineosporia sp. NBRC 101677]